MQLTGKNTRTAGKNTRQTQEKIPAQSQEKKLQFHADLPAIAGNLLSHRG